MAAGDKLALVFSGGGAKGAFGVGVLWQLVQELPDLSWGIVSGTSTGALITPLSALGAHDRAALTTLRDLYVGIRKDDVVESNFDLVDIPGDLLDLPDGLYNFDPLERTIAAALPEARKRKLLASDVVAIVNSVNLRTGALALWTQKRHRKTMKDWFAAHAGGDAAIPIEWISETKLERAMRASSAIPAGISPVTLLGDQHVDGGVTDLAPLRAAVAAGATHILAVMMSPRVGAPAAGPAENLVEVALRAVDLLTDEIGRNDVEVARQTTQLQPLAALLAATPPNTLPPNLQSWLAVPENARLVADLASRRQIQVEVIEPAFALGETLDFDAKVTAGWPQDDSTGTIPVMRRRFQIGREAATAALAAKPSLKAMLEAFA